jgi:hypothetical protein
MGRRSQKSAAAALLQAIVSASAIRDRNGFMALIVQPFGGCGTGE